MSEWPIEVVLKTAARQQCQGPGFESRSRRTSSSQDHSQGCLQGRPHVPALQTLPHSSSLYTSTQVMSEPAPHILDLEKQRAEDDRVRADLNQAIDSGKISGEDADQKNGWFALGWQDARIGRVNP